MADVGTVDLDDQRTVRAARRAVVGSLTATALLCVVGVLYSFVEPTRPWGVGLAVPLVGLSVAGDLGLRRTWRKAEGPQRIGTRRERLACAAEVAHLSATRVITTDRVLTVLWFAIVFIAIMTVRR